MPPAPTSPFGTSLLQVETVAAGLRHRHGVAVGAMRYAPVVGSHVPSPLGRLLRLPVVPVDALADPRQVRELVHQHAVGEGVEHGRDPGDDDLVVVDDSDPNGGHAETLSLRPTPASGEPKDTLAKCAGSRVRRDTKDPAPQSMSLRGLDVPR